MVLRKLSVPARPPAMDWHHQRAIVLSSQAGDLVTALPKGVNEDYENNNGFSVSQQNGSVGVFTAVNAAESSIRFVFRFGLLFRKIGEIGDRRDYYELF